MGLATALLLGLGVAQAGTQIAGGISASKEAKYNAGLYGAQAEMIEAQKRLEAYQYDRQKRRLVSIITARTAKSGLELSGSPLSVMLDDLTQMELDKQIGQYNLEYQKQQTLGAQATYLRQGKMAKMASYTNAFTSLLSTGAQYAYYKGMFTPKTTKKK